MTDASVDYEIKALTPDTWPDFEALVERTGGLFSGCWCVHFHHGVPDGRGEDEPNRDFKRRMVEAGVAHAALVYDGPDAVAWAEYGTPDELPNIHHRKQYDAESRSTLPDYRITCINVTKSHRKQGYGRAALRGAVRADRGGRRRCRRGLPARHGHARPGQEDERLLPLQPHPEVLRGGRLHLRPPQGPAELRDDEDGAAAIGSASSWDKWLFRLRPLRISTRPAGR